MHIRWDQRYMYVRENNIISLDRKYMYTIVHGVEPL